MNTLRCLIIEDQIPAQRIMKKYISDVPHLELVGVFGSALEATSSVVDTQIDLLFLDIHLPQLDGFSFLKIIKPDTAVIVTTAYSDYALEGYELSVTDYLLKPFSFERFLSAVSKVKVAPRQGHTERTVGESGSDASLFVKVDGEHIRVVIDDILYINAERDFVKICTKKQNYFILGTLTAWGNSLPSNKFMQIHKSHIVQIAEVSKLVGRRLFVGDTEFPIGRYYYKQVADTLAI